MGFRTGAYATVWEITPMSDTRTKIRLSTSKKNKSTGEFEQDFSGSVMFVGTANASRALALNRKDRIKIGDCDVTVKQSNDKKTWFTNFTVFSFEEASSSGNNAATTEPEVTTVDDGELDDSKLPF